MSTSAHVSLASHMVAIVALTMVCAGSASGQYTVRVSIASDGTQGNQQSWVPSISADGYYVAFHALASNLVPGDTNSDYDVFVRDRATGATTRLSVASDGTEANGPSGYASISADGWYVAFDSSATNLVSGDTNNQSDVFVRDRETTSTTRVSIASHGTQGNGNSSYASVSGDGRYVAFVSGASNLVSGDTNGTDDIFVRDRLTDTTTRVSIASDGTQSNGWSSWPSISADGRCIAFYSRATNLVPADTNAKDDVFVHDCDSGITTRVSVASNGTQGNGHSGGYGLAISPDGRYVAFESRASNLVTGDTNGQGDVFVHDRVASTTTRVSVASDGTQGNGSSDLIMNRAISADGRYLAFDSGASNLVADDTNSAVDVFVHRCNAGVPGDWNGDGDVDISDFAEFPTCWSGPVGSPDWVMPSQVCQDVFDFDGDTDVDLADFAEFQLAFGGP